MKIVDKEIWITIIIPCLNEVSTVRNTVLTCFNTMSQSGYKFDIIVVDNGSSDGSLEVLKEIEVISDKVKVVLEPKRGKGRALKTAIEKAVGDVIAFTDADGEYDCKVIPEMIATLIENDADMCLGIRHTYPYSIGIGSFIANKFFLSLLEKLYHVRLRDILTGQRVLKRDFCIFKSDDFKVETELVLNCIKKDGRIVEYPVRYNYRNKMQGKKIGFKDFLKISLLILSSFVSKKPFAEYVTLKEIATRE